MSAVDDDTNYAPSPQMRQRIIRERLDEAEVQRVNKILWSDLVAIANYAIRWLEKNLSKPEESLLKDPVVVHESAKIRAFIAEHSDMLDFAGTKGGKGMAAIALATGLNDVADMVEREGGELPQISSVLPIYAIQYLQTKGQYLTIAHLFDLLADQNYDKLKQLTDCGVNLCETQSTEQLKEHARRSQNLNRLLSRFRNPCASIEDILDNELGICCQNTAISCPLPGNPYYPAYEILVELGNRRQQWEKFVATGSSPTREQVMSFATIGHASDCFDHSFWKDTPDKATALLAELPAHIAESIIVDQTWLTAPHSNIDAASAARWRASMHKEAQR